MPLIALSPSWNSESRLTSIGPDYIDALCRAGGAPVILTFTDSEQALDDTLARMDGVVFSGGGDIAPARYGEQTLPCCGEITEARDRFEALLLRCAMRRRLPILGICRGLQAINVFLGGTLYQDIPEQYSRQLLHSRSDIGRDYAHDMSLVSGTLLYSIYQADHIQVNSRHHQAVKALSPALKANAISPDGLIEGAEAADGSALLCVQWHPESLQDRYIEHRAPFHWLLQEASR